MFSSWPSSALVDGVKIGSGSWSDSRVRSEDVAATSRRSPGSPSSPTGDVAAHDALEREHLEPTALGRAAVGLQARAGGSDDRARAREPERREAGQHAALVGYLGRQHDVEGRDPVARDEQQPLVVERVQLATFPLPTCAASGMDGLLLPDERRSRSKTVSTWRVYALSRRRVEVDAAGDLRSRATSSRKSCSSSQARSACAGRAVGLVAREPGLDEREQQPLAEEEAVARSRFRASARADDQASTSQAKRSSM
jgi:hypothetical protein